MARLLHEAEYDSRRQHVNTAACQLTQKGWQHVWMVSLFRATEALKRLQQALQDRPVVMLTALGSSAALVALAIREGTYVHPYLIADNRCAATSPCQSLDTWH